LTIYHFSGIIKTVKEGATKAEYSNPGGDAEKSQTAPEKEERI